MKEETKTNAINRHFRFISKLWIGNFIYTTVSTWLAFYSHHIEHWSEDPLIAMSVTAGFVKLVLSVYMCSLYNKKLKDDNITPPSM